MAPERKKLLLRRSIHGLLHFEILARVAPMRGWPLIMARNEWFKGRRAPVWRETLKS